MQRSSGPRFLPIFIIFVIVVIFIVAVVSIGKAIFGGGGDTSVVVDNGQEQLLNTSTAHSVRLTVRGPIVANEQFKSYTIDVSPSGRNMDVYNGYLDSLSKSKNYNNNEAAYEEFVYALDKAKMMKGKELSGEENDVRGICATGYVYQYDVRVNDRVVKSLWTSTCSGSKGSLDASVPQLNNLFIKQIPAYKDLTPFGSGPNLQLKF